MLGQLGLGRLGQVWQVRLGLVGQVRFGRLGQVKLGQVCQVRLGQFKLTYYTFLGKISKVDKLYGVGPHYFTDKQAYLERITYYTDLHNFCVFAVFFNPFALSLSLPLSPGNSIGDNRGRRRRLYVYILTSSSKRAIS